ncbi:(3S)-malyl-CoA thioesterase [Zhongshania aliphaticivorans]|uniref:(3S)-malyl-CoA thioesterase n=1 Tax=Zhongshania aliphaticivorans TaxID=1470434 RepID=A0A5S9QCL1_9GAMM|nr:CoA ester lyase [Zhongshania aliphaticivorans]CAA0087569.1 (3S)-malyl-CoA thioesterase [Zhongshania aliphaticivorans]CAA0115120.1 (3S)-malyl-CoA thioesterase [Zhongshania aliphaticivorans]CAA0119974.1 (3S)-malyl-CoA thioesterase [Zhongshania aliphaticivorans]
MANNPRRSLLYMPGSNTRALEKARSLDADVLILDLEDAVSPAQKSYAREQVLAAVTAGGYGPRELVVRVNGFDTEWGRKDIEAFANAPISALCLPKVESAAEIHAVVQVLQQAGANSKIKLWAMAETPRGILAVNDIAGAHPRMDGIVLGTSDLAKDLRVPHTAQRLGMLTSLGICVLAARAHGIDVFDGVHLDLEDEQGLLFACEQGVELGFDGKTLIHPKQLAITNQAFSPSEAVIARASKIKAAWQNAEAEGKGVVLVDGRLVEALHVEEAVRVLAIAQQIAERDSK